MQPVFKNFQMEDGEILVLNRDHVVAVKGKGKTENSSTIVTVNGTYKVKGHVDWVVGNLY